MHERQIARYNHLPLEMEEFTREANDLQKERKVPFQAVFSEKYELMQE